MTTFSVRICFDTYFIILQNVNKQVVGDGIVFIKPRSRPVHVTLPVIKIDLVGGFNVKRAKHVRQPLHDTIKQRCDDGENMHFW